MARPKKISAILNLWTWQVTDCCIFFLTFGCSSRVWPVIFSYSQAHAGTWLPQIRDEEGKGAKFYGCAGCYENMSKGYNFQVSKIKCWPRLIVRANTIFGPRKLYRSLDWHPIKEKERRCQSKTCPLDSRHLRSAIVYSSVGLIVMSESIGHVFVCGSAVKLLAHT